MYKLMEELRHRVNRWFATTTVRALSRRYGRSEFRRLIWINSLIECQGKSQLYRWIWGIRLLWALRGPVHSL